MRTGRLVGIMCSTLAIVSCGEPPPTNGGGPSTGAAPAAIATVTPAGGRHGTTRRELLPSGGSRQAAPLAASPNGFDYPATLVGSSGNVTVYYDSSLGSAGLTDAQNLLNSVASTYSDMETFFGISGGAVDVVVAPLSGSNDGRGGAYHYGCDFSSGGVLYLDATFAQANVDPQNFEIALYIAELSESFMGAQGTGWGCGSSNGEGLSRYLAAHETTAHTLDPSAFVTGPSWASAGFPDWISSTEGTDGDYPSIGAAVVYINWMRSLGYSVAQITQAAGSTLAINYQTLTGRTTAYGDLTAALSGIPVRSDNPFPMPDLLWQNPTSGEVGSWLLQGATVTGTQDLSWTCGSGCSSTWHPVDTLDDNTVLWDDPTSGTLSEWIFDDSGTIVSAPSLSWTCDAGSGCSSAWKAIGRVWQQPSCSFGEVCGSRAGLAWFNAGTGEVSIWNLLGSTVTGTQTVSWSCGGSCPSVWQPMLTADFNNDGNSDILWYAQSTGQLSVWLLDSSGTVIGTQLLSWTCDAGSGCASSWRLVDAADANGDGNVDLLWHNASSGVLSNWLLDGSGNVVGSPSLSWTCDSTCAASWTALGYVQNP